MWPQVLIAMLLLTMLVKGFFSHGKAVDAKPVNAAMVMWIIFTIAAVLGAGGFWGLR